MHKRFYFDSISVLGLPGSGKGTCCKALHDELGTGNGFVHVEMSKILTLRQEHDAAFKALCIDHMTKGTLVPCATVMNVFSDYMNRQALDRHYAFDGVPRTAEQALRWYDLLRQRGVKRLAVFHLLTTVERARANIRERWLNTPVSERRLDDGDDEVVDLRLNTCMQQIYPILAFCSGQNIPIIEINADVPVRDLVTTVKGKLGVR